MHRSGIAYARTRKPLRSPTQGTFHMIERTTALRRLLGTYLDELVRNPDYYLLVNLSDVLTHENIEAVRRLDLFPEQDRPRLVEALRRDQEMVSAWMASPKGGVQ
jgi:hypothetical protein